MVAEHVDQETDCAQAAAKFFKTGGGVGAGNDVFHQKFFDDIAHAQHGGGGLVQPQHRENTAHLRQLAGHFVQGCFVLRVAEKHVQGLFNLSQVGAQFVHHAAHGLAITHTPVQVLHPGLKRFGLSTVAYMFQALRQLHAALCHLGVGRIHVFIGRFQVQHGRGNFHGDRGRRRLAGFDGALDRMRHGARQLATLGVHFQDRLAHHCKLVMHGFKPVGVAAGQRRPGFRGSRNAFSHLHQHRRVKSAKLDHAVIERLGLQQFVGLAHGRQNRCAGGCRRYSLGAEKKQILRQAVRDAGVSFGQRGILQQDARRTPLRIDIAWAQPQGTGLKEGCANFPKHPRWELGLCLGQTQGQAGQLRRRVGVSNFHQPKHRLIQLAAHRRFIGQGHNVDRNCGIDPLPIEWPQIGRVDAFAVNHFQHIAVLHKQRHRRAGLAL